MPHFTAGELAIVLAQLPPDTPILVRREALWEDVGDHPAVALATHIHASLDGDAPHAVITAGADFAHLGADALASAIGWQTENARDAVRREASPHPCQRRGPCACRCVPCWVGDHARCQVAPAAARFHALGGSA